MYRCKRDGYFLKLLFIRNFIFIGLFTGFLCLVSCGGSKHTRCYAYSAEKKATATDDSSPFGMKSKNGNKSFFSFFGSAEEKSPFERKKKKEKKKKHKEGLFPQEMIRKK